MLKKKQIQKKWGTSLKINTHIYTNSPKDIEAYACLSDAIYNKSRCKRTLTKIEILFLIHLMVTLIVVSCISDPMLLYFGFNASHKNKSIHNVFCRILYFNRQETKNKQQIYIMTTVRAKRTSLNMQNNITNKENNIMDKV